MRDGLRVVVAVKPRILGEVLAKLAADNFGARVQSLNPDEADVLRLAKRVRADFVILSSDEPRMRLGFWQEVLRRSRQTRVILLGVSSDFALVLRYEERFRATRIEDSVHGILTALSGSADEGQPVGTVAPLVYPTGPLAESCAELFELNLLIPSSEEEFEVGAGEESAKRVDSGRVVGEEPDESEASTIRLRVSVLGEPGTPSKAGVGGANESRTARTILLGRGRRTSSEDTPDPVGYGDTEYPFSEGDFRDAHSG